MLLDELTSTHRSLGEQLGSLGTKFRDGLTQGSPANQTRAASELNGLPLLQSGDLQYFRIPEELPTYKKSTAQWPRSRDTYRSPLLIVKEMLLAERAMVAVAHRDLVFTDSFFAVSLPAAHEQTAHLLAAVLSSALASWFFGLTAAEFGIYKRKLLMRDVGCLPVPDFGSVAKTQAGKSLVQLGKTLRKRDITAQDWITLDEAVFDLYALGETDRVLVRDGLQRAGWQWEAGRESSMVNADTRLEVARYAKTFLTVMAGWLSVRNKRHMRAELIDVPNASALRVVRFVLEDGPGDADVSVVTPRGDLSDVLTRIGRSLKVKIATALTGQRELRVHGRNEVVIIKPAARRYWMGAAALEDADAVIAESFTGGRA